MTLTLNHRWLIVAVIWMATLVMTWWNFNTIDAVSKERDNGERLRKEFVFQQRNSAKLHQVGDLHATHAKPVASVKLGFESVRSSLHALAALLGLGHAALDSGIFQA